MVVSWKKPRLGQIVSITKGKKHQEVADCSATRYIQIEDLSSNSFEKFTNEAGVSVFPTDVIIAWDGANAGRVGADMEGVIGSTLARLRPHENGIVGKYLFRFLQANEAEIKSKRTGATIPHVNGQELRNMQIPLPSLPTQQKIAAILDKADELRRKDKALLAHYDELLQSIFYKMFGDPVKNEKGWEMKEVGDVLSSTKEGTKCGPFGSALKKEEYSKNGIPVWVMDNIQNSDFIEDGCLFISQEKFQELKGYETENGDIIISRAGTVGKMAVVKTNHPCSIISTNLIKLSLDSNLISSSFFVYLVKYFGHKLGRLKKGQDGSFTHMNTGIIKSLKIPVPPIKIQQGFDNCLKQISNQKNGIGDVVRESENLFQSLLQKAFKGELVQ